MANSSNVYATAEPLQGNISNWLLSQEEMGLRQQAEKRRQEEFEHIKQQKQQEREDKLRERLLSKIPQNYDTGSSSLNGFQAGIIKEGANRLGDIYIKLKDPNLSDAEKTKLEIEAQNIGNLPENLKLSTDNFTKLIGDYKAGVAGGSFWENPEFEKKVLNGFENYVGGLDENGLPIVGFVDKDGDGKMDVMGYENLSQGIGVWKFQPKLDRAKMIAETAKSIGTVEKGKPLPGYQNRVTKGMSLVDAQKAADALTKDSNGNLTDFAKSEFRRFGIENPTPEQIVNLTKDFTEELMMTKDRSDVTKKDYGAQNSAARLAFDQSKQDEDKNPIAFVEKTPNSTKFALKKPVLFQSKNKNNQPGTVTNVEVDKDGKITLTASVLKEKKTVKSMMNEDGEETSITQDVYEDVPITKKEEVTAILSGVTGLDSYVDIQNALKQQAAQYQNSDLPDLDDLPDLE